MTKIIGIVLLFVLYPVVENRPLPTEKYQVTAHPTPRPLRDYPSYHQAKNKCKIMIATTDYCTKQAHILKKMKTSLNEKECRMVCITEDIHEKRDAFEAYKADQGDKELKFIQMITDFLNDQENRSE